MLEFLAKEGRNNLEVGRGSEEGLEILSLQEGEEEAGIEVKPS